MNTYQKLLAFFAANATIDEYSKFQEYIANKEDEEKYPFLKPIHYGKSKYSTEELKFLFAQSMIEKYKEFESLLD